MTARDLKNRTGEALRSVKQGEKVVITVHGKPRAILSPPGEAMVFPEDEKKIDKAWNEIEEALTRSRPRFKSWQEATNWSRKRGQSF
ncbi:MAG TPA: type II toxin-antitoxin system prevent-host-death family antitoxin [Thermodesulfobacteriota bacterium]|nr:type II toxin-antitoxin system prevent-host-death family antitoxin [Thermodesulfobacteriota bacterium]